MEVKFSREPATVRGLIQGLKKSKRRAIERSKQKVGIADSNVDIEYGLAVKNFLELDKDLHRVLVNIKEALRASSEAAEKYEALSRNMTKFYADSSPDDPMKQHTEEYLAATSRMAQKQAGFVQLIEARAIQELDNLLNQKFVELKKTIAKHNGIKTDVESYTRRCKALETRGKDGNDPEYLKMQHKLGRAISAYNVCHPELMTELRTVYDNRHKNALTYFTVVIMSLESIQQSYSDDLNQFLHGMAQTHDMTPIANDFERLKL